MITPIKQIGLGVFMSITTSAASVPSPLFIETFSAQEVYETITQAKLPPKARLFFDVDDTLIVSCSTSLQCAPQDRLIDQLKEDKHLYPDFEEILSCFRLQRKSMLLDNAWPKVLESLKKRYSVHALTQMGTGQFGKISSMETWRYEELKSLGITFTGIGSSLVSKDKASFFQGILMTGPLKKSETLDTFQSLVSTNFVVFVDDRSDHLQDVQTYCHNQGIGFMGILYKGLDTLKTIVDPQLVAFQKDYLIKHKCWLEDDQARQLMGPNQP
jgi:hypothetical protein